MAADDRSTLITHLEDITSGEPGAPKVPALTIAWHTSPERIGGVAPLTALLESDIAVLNREEPWFVTPGSNVGRPVESRWMSKTDSVLEFRSVGTALELRRGSDSKSSIDVDGAPLSEPRTLGVQDLERGVVITVARRFVFVLHTIRFPVTRSPTLGLVGVSDAIEEVRRQISRVAPLDAPVIIRGETGTGKELVAKAIHETSRRRAKPLVTVDLGTLRPEHAAAHLFGHEKGAFTGADTSRPGSFGAANGGTLFLDEFGSLLPDIQPSLLRVLADRQVQPLGAPHGRPLDVRVLVATDARLEEAVRNGRFLSPLYYRVEAFLLVKVPPLRARREDIGLLFFTFLRAALTASGQVDRLAPAEDKNPPWLSAGVVAQLCLFHWPGNVRTLKGFAEKLAVNADDQEFRTSERVREYLSQIASTSPEASPPPPTPLVRRNQLTNDAILDALDRANWQMSHAAKLLGVEKYTLSKRLKSEEEIRRLAKLSNAELDQQFTAVARDVCALARTLKVPEPLLARRLRRLS